MRTNLLPVLGLLLSAACTTTDPGADLSPAAMPMGETAAVVGRDEEAAGTVYAQSEAIQHEWTTASGRRMHVCFRLAWSAPAAEAADAADRLREHWAMAQQQARELCEAADLLSEDGTVRCEQQLCEELGRTLFPRAKGEGGPLVERVIWKRLIWR